MARTFTALVTLEEDFLGAAGPFAVDVPWWAEVEPVNMVLRRELGVPVFVLRLLRVSGGESPRDGHVLYHVEALDRPRSGVLRAGDAVVLAEDHPLRLPWARRDGLLAALDWASSTLTALGRPVTGPVVQRKTWNLAALFRLPTAAGPVWLKLLPPFASDEAAVIAALARVDPTLVPTVLAATDGRMLLDHLPGEDCWQAPAPVIAAGITRMVAAQAALAGTPLAVPDRRGSQLTTEILELLDRLPGLTPDERSAARGLAHRWPELDCGIPDTLVHGDFHSGNWRSAGGPPVILDFADAYLGNPVLDGLRVIDFLPAPARPAATAAWTSAWQTHAPTSTPAHALTLAEPLAHLAYAVRYQEFLDNIEPSEHPYHANDPITSVRAALNCGYSPIAIAQSDTR